MTNLAYSGSPKCAVRSRLWLILTEVRRSNPLTDSSSIRVSICVHPSLSTSGETLTIEESMNLEGENGACRTWRRARMELEQRLRLLPPAAKTSLA